jgi:hypothetical protein
MAKAKTSNEENCYAGCYGPKMSYSEIQDFLKLAFKADDYAELNHPNERFSTSIWGLAGCVLKGTKITVRKVSNEGNHKIVKVV